jgi:hypothetical protein
MVAMLEIVFLILCAVLGSWWFSRTNVYRAHRRSPGDPGQFVDERGRFGELGSRDEGPQRRPHRP